MNIDIKKLTKPELIIKVEKLETELGSLRREHIVEQARVQNKEDALIGYRRIKENALSAIVALREALTEERDFNTVAQEFKPKSIELRVLDAIELVLKK